MICDGQVIRVGSTDQVTVKAIKVRLNELLKTDLDIHNGNFGDTTEAAVRAFQKSALLIQDGEVGPLTWERLFTVRPDVPISGITTTDRNLHAMELMKSQLWVREKTGNNDGPEVEKFLKSVGLGKGYSWCMAFVFWAHNKTAEDLKIPLLTPKTAGVLECLRRAKKYVITGAPLPGDQFIMDFGGGHGHTGVVTLTKDKYIYTVEGNTAADPSYKGEDREGNGVFERNRPISSITAFIRYV